MRKEKGTCKVKAKAFPDGAKKKRDSNTPKRGHSTYIVFVNEQWVTTRGKGNPVLTSAKSAGFWVIDERHPMPSSASSMNLGSGWTRKVTKTRRELQ